MINYLTGLGYPADAESLERWWSGASVEHVIGKGILRFHAVYWPAILLSAGLPLPDRIDVHEYLTVDGAKISKSAGGAADPAALVMTYGADALRWWLVRDVARAGDTDFTESRLIARANEDLANTIGNLVGRTTTLARRYAVPESVDGAGIGPAEGSERLRAAASGAAARSGRDRVGAGRLRLPPRVRGGRRPRVGGEPVRRYDAAVGAWVQRAARGRGRRDR